MPTLRALARDGVSAEGMRTINPTVTWPNHTTMVTGVSAARHDVIFNGKVSASIPNLPVTVDEHPRKDNLVKVPTLYDVAHNAGLVTAQVAWVATGAASTLSWNFPEEPNPDGVIERELITQGTVTRDQIQHFSAADQSWKDEIATDAAIDILAHHTPSLLLLHLLETDSIQHEYGPHSSAANAAYAFVDDRFRQILEALDRLHLRKRAAIFVVSDHGFRNVHHAVNLNIFLQQQGYAKPNGNSFTADCWTISHGGIAMVYITDPAKRQSLLPKLEAQLAQVEGVAHVFRNADLPAIGIPARAESTQSPDLVLEAKPDYYFDEEITGDMLRKVQNGGEHGYLNTDPDMNAIFLAAGAGIRRGVHLGVIPNVDLAPTLARLLGLQMKDVEGHALTQILTVSTDHDK